MKWNEIETFSRNGEFKTIQTNKYKYLLEGQFKTSLFGSFIFTFFLLLSIIHRTWNSRLRPPIFHPFHSINITIISLHRTEVFILWERGKLKYTQKQRNHWNGYTQSNWTKNKEPLWTNWNERGKTEGWIYWNQIGMGSSSYIEWNEVDVIPLSFIHLISS